MRTRIITAVVGIAILLPILWLADTYLLVVATALLAVVGIFEMMRCLGVHRNIAATWPLYLLAAGCLSPPG